MTINFEEFPCNFVGSFKVGDNLAFNAGVLCKLVETNEDGLFNKLIVLQVGSIMEAALAQIIYRAQTHNREGVPNISEDDRAEIEGQKIDKFHSVIDVLKKYKVLSDLGEDIYEDLHKLRKYRNKVHIQDVWNFRGIICPADSHHSGLVQPDQGASGDASGTAEANAQTR
jgi:hypothetical protein